MTRKDVVKPATKKKAFSNDWSFASDYVGGDDDDGEGKFPRDTMLCFKKHGVVALTFHPTFESGIVCAKCFQYMKPGSFALHCEKCDLQDAPTKKEVKKWKDSDKKWANLKRNDGDIFTNKTSIWIATRDGFSAYVVHPRFYLGKTSSTLKLKAMCIADGCTRVCALNALYRHFKDEHMTGVHTIHPLTVIEAPLKNKVDVSDDEGEDDDGEESEDSEVDEDVTKNNKTDDGLRNEDNDGSESKNARKAEEGNGEKGEDEEVECTKGEKSFTVDDAAHEGADVGGEPLELDCEAYVEEGGPSDPDTDVEEDKAMKAPVKAKTSRKKKSAYTSDGPRKSTRVRRVTARY
jgi:hypothetical protein